jgi:ketosteroid isomerase-like protein
MMMGGLMSDEVEFLKRVYDRFNARDMETVLAVMREDVIWENGMEGGHVQGRNEVRSYWTRQWAIIDPHVEPVAFAEGPEGEVVVEVHQVVRDLNGNLLADKMVGHVFRIENHLIKRFDIRSSSAWGDDRNPEIMRPDSRSAYLANA